MISQAPISAAPISIIVHGEDKDVYYFVNDCRSVFVLEESRSVKIPDEPRIVEVKC